MTNLKKLHAFIPYFFCIWVLLLYFYYKDRFHLLIHKYYCKYVSIHTYLSHSILSVSFDSLLSAIVHLLPQINVCKNMRTALFCVVCALLVFIMRFHWHETSLFDWSVLKHRIGTVLHWRPPDLCLLYTTPYCQHMSPVMTGSWEMEEISAYYLVTILPSNHHALACNYQLSHINKSVYNSLWN